LKPETEIRNLKRQVKDWQKAEWRVRAELNKLRTEVDAYRARATKAEQECAEWKARFDVLLRREEPKP
jgi:molecular chaperone GrpE (heat shock protein)